MHSRKHACMLTDIPRRLYQRPLAGLWSRLLSRARYLMLPADWHHASKLFLRSQKALEIERCRQIATSFFVLHPYSPIKFYWDTFNMIIYTAALIYMPLQVFFYCPNPYDLFILFNDFISFMVIIINFITGSVDEDGKKFVLRPEEIAVLYLKDTFILDVVAALPLQCIKLRESCKYPMHTIFYLCKIFRMAAVGRVWKCWSCQLRLSYLVIMAITLCSRSAIFFHWMTYIHYQIPILLSYKHKHTGLFLMWLQRCKIQGLKNETVKAIDKYVTNLYYVSGVSIGSGIYSSTGGDAQTSEEQLLSAILGIVGLLFMTYFFSTLLRLVIYSHYESYLYNGRLKELQVYLTFKRVPKSLQQKIQLYINYRFNGHYFNEKAILNTINIQIKQEINMFCCKSLVTKVPLFQDMPVALINTIIFSLRQVLYMPGEVVVTYGHPGGSIYLIASGTVAIMNAFGKEVGHMKDGAYFGEKALLKPGTLRSATIVALEITEIYKLNHEQFQACLQPCPRLKRRLQDMASNISATPTTSPRGRRAPQRPPHFLNRKRLHSAGSEN